MSDIVERLRAITGQAGDHGDVQLCDAAADEIERLRLTDAEREAVEQALDFVCGMQRPDDWAVATLRGLLERTSATDAVRRI